MLFLSCFVLVSFPDLCTLSYFVEAVEKFFPSKMTKTKYSVPWINVTMKRLLRKDISFTFVLVNPRTLMSRLITSGSEHMYRSY